MSKTKSKARYGDGCIYLRGRIYWLKYREARGLPDGSVTYELHYESTKSEDRDFAQRQLRSKLTALGGRRPSVVDPKKVSYEDIRENYLTDRTAKGMRSLKWKGGKATLDTLPRLDKFFGTWRASDITIADLKRFRAEAKVEGLTDARINRYMATLRAMLKQAVKDEILTGAEIPGYFPSVKEPNEAVGAVYIESKWYGLLRKELKEPLRSAFTLAYNTSIRVHEMQRLHWRDFDFQKRTIVLPGKTTKTAKLRTIFIPRDFDRKPGKPDELVFPLGDYRSQWYRACAKVGAGYLECRQCHARCDGQKCPTHGFQAARELKYHGALLRHCRHTAVRNMDDAGLTQTRIMAMSGHLTDSMFRRYNIGREKDVALVRETMDRFHRSR
jgi:integrase